MAFSLPAYKCFKISAFAHYNKVIMRYECLTVKGLDVALGGEVARKTGLCRAGDLLWLRGKPGI
jgi:hypothetical protein